MSVNWKKLDLLDKNEFLMSLERTGQFFLLSAL